jgi:hypothetical protein
VTECSPILASALLLGIGPWGAGRVTVFWPDQFDVDADAATVPTTRVCSAPGWEPGCARWCPDRFASHGSELIGHIFVPGPVITYDRSQPVAKAGFGPGQRRGG